MISCSSSLASSTPATSLNVTFFWVLEEQLGAALAERERLVAAALHLAHEEDPEADHQQDRRPARRAARPRDCVVGSFADHLDVALDELVAERPVLRRRIGPELLARTSEVPRISLPVIVTFWTCPSSSSLTNSLKVIGLVAVWNVRGEVPDEHPDDDEHHPEEQALERRVQPAPPDRLTPILSRVTRLSCAGVTRASAASTWPATQRMRSRRHRRTSGTRSR